MILEILSRCTVEGKVVKLPEGQLDSGDYLDVKRKLEGIGGKWKGGKTQGFVFEEDPTELLAAVSGGQDINLKQQYQFFPTPASLAEKMIALIPSYEPWMRVCEPSAGDGALVKAFVKRFGAEMVHAVECFEIMELNLTKLRDVQGAMIKGMDFLTAKVPEHEYYDIIIANPPFTRNQDIDHIRKMFEVCKPGGIIITMSSVSWTFGEQKKQVDFRDWLASLGATITDIEAGTFKESGTAVRACLVVVNKPVAIPLSDDDHVKEFKKQLRHKIIGLFVKHQIKDFSDSEIERCLSGCVLPGVQASYARGMVADGLTMEEVYNIAETEAAAPIKENFLPVKESKPAKAHKKEKERTCRVCGCTDNNCRQCIEKTGHPCHWVEKDLCSACYEPEILRAPEDILDDMIQNHKEIEKSFTTMKQLLNSNSNEMKFFTSLQATAPGSDITLRIKEKNGKFTVSITNNVGGQSNIKPLIVTGVPEELDTEFFTLIGAPLRDANVQLHNLEEFKQSMSAHVADETKKASPKKPEPAKEVKAAPAKPAEVKPKEKPKAGTGLFDDEKDDEDLSETTSSPAEAPISQQD